MKQTDFFKSSLMILLMCFGLTSVWGQELLLNGDFESWDNSSTPTNWTHVENIAQESVNINSGSFSAKHTGGTKDLGQTISGIIPGESYTITIWYKVQSGDSTSARIWSYWQNSGTNITDPATENQLRGPGGSNGYFDNNGNVWTEYTTTVTAPANADSFYFEVRTYSGAIVYWDDFSFFHNIVSADPTLTANPTSISDLNYVEGNGPSSSGSFTLSASNWDDSDVELLVDEEFEISDNETDWTGHLQLPAYDGSDKTIYVRMKSGLSIDDYTGTVLISGSSADDVSVDLSGSVTAPPPVAIPTITADGVANGIDTYWNSAEITLATTTPDATIYYTINEGATLEYSAPFTITETSNIEAYATADGLDDSEVSTKTITITTPATTTLPYEEDFDGTLGDWVSYTDAGVNWVAEASGASVNGHPSQSELVWLISPEFSSVGAGILLSFDHTSQYTNGNDLEIRYSTDYAGYGDPTTATWTTVEEIAPVSSGSVSEMAIPASGNVHIALVYTDVSLPYAQWTISNLSVEAPSTDPAILVTPSTVPDFTTEVGADDTEEITINGINLDDDIMVAISDDTNFSVSANSFTQTDGNVSETLTITYSPATAGSHTATVTLSSTGADDVVLDLNGTATLGVPVATAATEISSSGFTANWEEVPGAESYEIDVYTMEDSLSEALNEEFTWLDNGTGGNDGSWSGNVASATSGLDTHLSDWAYDRAYKGDNCIKVGSSNGQGYLTTPILGFIGNGTLTFRAGAWDGSNEQTNLHLEISGGGSLEVNQVEMAKGAFTNYEVQIYNATTETKITFRGWQASSSRFFLDDILVMGTSQIITPITGSPFTTNETSQAITGLEPETTYYYVVRAIAGEETTANSNEIEVTTTEVPAAITWLSTNEWSNVDGPTINDDAVVEGDLTVSTALEAKNLTVSETGSVTIADGGSLTLSGKLTNNATSTDFVVESGGNLVQNTDYTADDNAGAITVKRNSQDIVRLDYTMWSSPVKNQQLQVFSPETLPNRIYTYETNSTTEGDHGYDEVDDAETDFIQGKGYLFRAPNNWPIPAGSPEGDPYEGVFTGEPTNGNVSVSTFNGGYTSIGNPYPSNIDPALLMAQNSGIQTIYFWNNPERVETEPGVYEYQGTKYVTYAGGSYVPSQSNQMISAGQGFIVYSTADNVNFDNSMRVTAQENFFKTNTVEHNRFWLSLKNDNQAEYNQLLVNYMTGATNEVDQQIDAQLFGYSGSAIYNLINEEAYVIQGRALPFADTDVVPLGFKAEEAGKFIVSLVNFDGLFAEGETTIYLKDKELNITHNLIESDYTFDAVAGTFNERFEIVYAEDEVMSVDDLTAGNILIYKNQKAIAVKSADAQISSVEAYDLQGKLIHNQTQVNAQAYQFESVAKGVLVIRVKTADGKTISKKIIN